MEMFLIQFCFPMSPDDDFWTNLTEMTQLRANQRREARPNSYFAKQMPADKSLSIAEMKAFIGCRLYMEYSCQRRAYRDYFCVNGKDFVIETPGFNSIFARDRFLAIWSFLHTVNELDPTLDKSDKIYKNRKMIDDLQEKFRNYFCAPFFLALDEGMIPAKNRLAIKQYIPSKPIKWGIKSFLICDSETGYILGIIIYLGKEDEPYKDLGATGNTVVRLLHKANCAGKGHCVVMDRFYSSVLLAEHLYRIEKTYTVGTIRTDRKFYPKALVKRNGDRGDMDYLCVNNITAFVWIDRKPINFISNYHNPTQVTTVDRKDKQGVSHQVPTFQAVKDYNTYMGGCDRNDQMARLHRTRKHYKWPRRLFMKSIMWAVYNAFILYKSSRTAADQKKVNFTDYVNDICRSLISDHRSAHIRKRRPSFESERRLQNVGLHTPVFEDNVSKGHVCVVCQKKHHMYMVAHPGVSKQDNPCKSTKSCIKCSDCNAYLCVKRGSTCWTDYHTKKEFWR